MRDPHEVAKEEQTASDSSPYRPYSGAYKEGYDDALEATEERVKKYWEARNEALEQCAEADGELWALKQKYNELVNLLKERDGGAHDADCRVRYRHECTCGHEDVVGFLKREFGVTCYAI